MARLKRQATLPLLATLSALALVLVICLPSLSGAAQAITTTSTLGQASAAHTLTGSAPPTTIPQSSGTQAAPSPLVIHAKAAIVIDMDSGQILYSHNANARRAIASTTKIMTTILTLETLPLDQVVTVSARAANVGEQSLGLKAGERLTVEQLLYGALVHSANDAAFALAEACGGTMEAFVRRMNEEASQLGLSNTHYVNPDGLDAVGHYSSARDLATLARYAMQNPEFRKIVSTVNYSLTLPGKSQPFVFRNVNKLLGSVSWVTGIKTGSTNDAGFCLVASGTQDGTSVISVVLGEPSWTPTWVDSKALLEYGFEQEQAASILRAGVSIPPRYPRCSDGRSCPATRHRGRVAHSLSPGCRAQAGYRGRTAGGRAGWSQGAKRGESVSNAHPSHPGRPSAW